MFLLNDTKSTATTLVGVRGGACAHTGLSVWTSGAHMNRQHHSSAGTPSAQRSMHSGQVATGTRSRPLKLRGSCLLYTSDAADEYYRLDFARCPILNI